MYNKLIPKPVFLKIKAGSFGQKDLYDFDHKCGLPPPDDLVERYICSGIFVKWRRKLKNLVICSERNARTKLFFKSSNAIFNQKYKHLEFDFNMIHPFSIGRAYWEFFMFFVFIIMLNYIPLHICLTHSSVYICPYRLLMDIFCYIDMGMSFSTGYQHPLTKKVIMKRKLITKHYFGSWFMIDLLSSINPDIIIYIIHAYTGKLVWQIKILSMFKIFRISTVLLYLTRLKEWFQINWFIYQMVKLAIIILIMILWHASVLFLAAYHLKEVWIVEDCVYHSFKTVISRTIGCILIIGEKGNPSTLMLIIILEVAFTVIGWIYRIIITTQITLLVLKVNPIGANHAKLVQEFEEYVVTKKLPKLVKKRVLNYLEFKFHGKFYREVVIWKTLSNSLKQEINLFICRKLLNSLFIFHNLPMEIVMKLSNNFKHEIYLHNDVIIQANTPAEEILFIVTGMAAIYNESQKEINHFLAGDCYGDFNLFVNAPIAEETIVAIDCCEIYSIKYKDIKKIMLPYPEIWAKICKVVRTDIIDPLRLLDSSGSLKKLRGTSDIT
nr:potassium/sodium hyperpolarization-activated cyclic nucleotide-gated channel 1-like [Onthophagus taurus]